MVPAHLDGALARHDPQRRLGPEVDQLSPEVTLVLGHILVQRRRQPRVIPGGGFRVVVDKVHSGRVSQTHFPSTRQGAELGNGLLLDALGSRRSSIHPDVLLSARIHPGSGAGVVVDKVNPAFRSMSLLPSR